MRIAICDDSIACISTIKKFIEQVQESEFECDSYESGESLISVYTSNKDRYDLIFLDMEMEKLNGIETANKIREFDEHVIIIFVTSHTEYVFESFKCFPLRFLIKPIEFDKFEEAFKAACKSLKKQRKILQITENKTRIRLYCDDIIYCESTDHWVTIYTKDEEYKLYMTLNELYELLDKEMLFRVHKSFVVNFNYLRTIKGNNICLYNSDKIIPISRSYKKGVVVEYARFMERNMYI